MAPAITVHMNKPSTPWTATILQSHDERAGRAGYLSLRAAQQRNHKTVTIAQ